MDAFLLLAALAEIECTLVGGLVREVAAVGAGGLWLDLATSRGPEGLLVLTEPCFPRIVRSGTRPPKTRPLPALAGSARQRLPGTRLAAIGRRGLDRVVILDFEPALEAGRGAATGDAGGRLILELFGSQPNLLLTDLNGTIVEAARHRTSSVRPCRPGLPYVPPPPAGRPDPRTLGSAEAIAAAIEPWLAAGHDGASALRHSLTGLNDLWAREIVARADDTSAAALAEALVTLLGVLRTSAADPHVVTDEAGAPTAVTPVRLVHLPEARQRAHATLADALDRLADHLAARQELATALTDVRRILRRLEERLRSRLAKLRTEATEFGRADLYQRMGETLVASQNAVPRGADKVTLPDHTGEPGATLTIPLDPTLSANANAERLFRLARRGRRGAMRVTSRLAETEAALDRVRALSTRAVEAREPSALAALRQELERSPIARARAGRGAPVLTPNPPAGPTTARSAPKPPAPRRVGERRTAGPEPRRFVSSEGLPILVGRDNVGNDHLTVHIARSEDLWLHVEGFAGSHVVVRMQGRTGGVPRQTLLEAAKLAAYYSQARSHGKVTVSYTLKKFVRKPRKSPPGLVTVTHEKTIVVKPDKALVAQLATAPTDEGP
jgi:predicted ribosome quality control (RQC) complex YloA/Tae2 family protein